MKIQSYILKNNLRVMLIDTQAFPSITTLLLVKAGSRYETPKNNGIAHFFEHMAFKGSIKYPNAQMLAEMIEGRGGIFNAFTSDDHTGYYVKAPAEETDAVIDVIGDMIQHPLLDPVEIEKEKGVIVQEMNMYEDMPQRTIYEHFETLLFGKHPLGYRIIGTKKAVTGATQDTFKEYITDWYHPSNAVLVLAGGLTSIDGRTLSYYSDIIDARFSPWNDAMTPEYQKVAIHQLKAAGSVTYKKSEQAHFCLGYRAFDRSDPRRHALIVLCAVLGMGMSSRLFREMREKRGLCYTVHTYSEHYDDAGYIGTYAGVEPSTDKVTEAMKVVLDEHDVIATELVPADELVRAKELLKGRLILSLEDTYNVAALYGTKNLFQNETFDIGEHIKKIEAVSSEDIRSLAQELFVRDQRNIALIGPFKDEEILTEHLSRK